MRENASRARIAQMEHCGNRMLTRPDDRPLLHQIKSNQIKYWTYSSLIPRSSSGFSLAQNEPDLHPSLADRTPPSSIQRWFLTNISATCSGVIRETSKITSATAS